MPSVNLHVSNRLDRLAAALARTTAGPLESPFTPEVVVVQSGAMRRWLALRLAEHQGICANFDFPFIGEMVARLIEESRTALPLAARAETDLLAWRIESALRRCTGEAAFASVARYLDGGGARQRFALASRIANLFDQYRVYRPDLLLKWAAGKKADTWQGDEAWQAKLWLEVDGSSDFDRALGELRTHGFSKAATGSLPARLCVFAPAALAPAYLDLLCQLGRVSEVHLFLLRPSPIYYGDDPTPKMRARLGAGAAGEAVGNPLLASWGRADAELTGLLLETEERLAIPLRETTEDFREPAPGDLLSTLQNDIFHASAAPGEAGDAKRAADPADRSLVLNACHSPMREVEVLYDQLLECFERYPDLRPRDILVMTPEIEKYAPLIRAVFEYPEQENRRIPYAIADRHPRSESEPIDLFLTLLGLADTRYTAPDLFLLLSTRLLRQRFGLADDDLSLIRGWIEATAIRWGIDAAHREAQGVPAAAANTWRHGLDRLLLGFAMEGNERQMFAGILPHDEVEGDGAATLGRFLTAAEALFALATDFAAARPLGRWQEPLLRLADTFFDPKEEDDVLDVRFLRTTIARLGEIADALPAAEPVDFQAVREFLETQVGTMEQRGSFLSGNVTFCALKPVRSLPAEIICVLGLNDQVFPRRPHLAQFDLMAARRPGDPAPGADDRFAFLETVLSARRKLWLSYIGRSVQDNKRIPPSVVVSELLDYLDEAWTFPGGQSAEQFLVAEHPLHAFSPQYFAQGRPDPRLFSYSRANAEASGAIHSAEPTPERPFAGSPLAGPPAGKQEIDLGDLVKFWLHPCRYFLRTRLGVELREKEESLAADEPFNLNAWEQYPIKQELLAGQLGLAPAGSPEAFAARGVLPPGALGELQLRALGAEAGRFARVVQEHLGAAGPKQPRDLKLILGKYTLSGRLNSIYGGRALYFRCAKLKPADQIRAWIEHLALSAADGPAAGETVLIGTDKVVSFGPVDGAAKQLGLLCRLFQEGATRPLPFFLASALAYVKTEFDGRNDPLRSARHRWNGDKQTPAEKDDAYVARCFNAGDPLDEPFIELARQVCLPLVTNRKVDDLA